MQQATGTAARAAALALAAGLVTALAAPGAAYAQVRGIPVYNSGVARGIALYGDVGFPNDDAGNGTALALTGRVGFGVLGVTAMVSQFNPDGPAGSATSVGGTANFRVFGGPLIPFSVTLQGGVGYEDVNLSSAVSGSRLGGKRTRFPVGLGFALVIPNPALAIRPWLAPRLDVERVSLAGTTETDANFGISGGVELNLLNGFGAHAAYDWISRGSLKPSTFAIGAHYAFRVPGF